MEDKSIAITTTATNGKTSPTESEKAKKNKKKRGPFNLIKSAMFMVRRGSDSKTKPPVQLEVASNDKLMKLVGSMRPLHLQDNQSPPPSTARKSDGIISKAFSSPDRPSSSSSVDSISQYGSATNLQALDKGNYVSPYASSTNLQELVTKTQIQILCLEEAEKGSESSDIRYASLTNFQQLDKRSDRYASAKDLLELDLKGESGDEDDSGSDDDLGNNDGDEMIDAKADEFIAKFYNQMKIQHKQSFERY